MISLDKPFLVNPLDRAQLVEFLRAALDEEIRDGDERNEKRWYWGDTGYWVHSAVAWASRVMDPEQVPDPVDPAQWLVDACLALEKVHQEYRYEREDPDGYGSGTLHQLRRRLEALRDAAARAARR